MYLLLGQLRLMDADGFRDLFADGNGGIQRRHGVLKHIGEQLSPEFSHILFRVIRDIHTVCPDFARFDFCGFGQQLHNRLTEHTFAAAGLSNNGKYLTGVQGKAHIPDGLHLPHGGLDANR